MTRRRALIPLLFALGCGDAGSPTPTPALPTPTPTWPAAFAECAPWQPEAFRPVDPVTAPFWEGAVIYQVWVRSFLDGAGGDGVGDLQGITAKLDYIAALGTTVLWLSPTFPSPSDHGYDVLDYTATRALYGGEEALDALVAATRARGIEILLDVPINHTSIAHPWFQASVDPSDPARGDFRWSDEDPGLPDWHALGGDYYYGHFWSGMPDLNYESAAVRERIAVALEGWMDRGIKAFRIDAARHLVEEGAVTAEHPGTYCALRGLRQTLAQVAPDVLLIGEIWSNPQNIASYLDDGSALGPQADLLPLAFDFPIAEQILSSVKRGGPVTLLDAHKQRARFYPDPAMGVPFLSNHDQDRVASQLGADPAQLKLAAGLLFSVPGPVTVYYGEELGMTGAKTASDTTDNPRRSPMQWTGEGPGYGFTEGSPWYPVNSDAGEINVAAQAEDPDSLLSLYRHLGQLRAAHPPLATGEIVVLTASEPAIYAVARVQGGDVVLIVANLGEEARAEVEVDLSPLWPEAGWEALSPLLQVYDAPEVTLGERATFRALAPRGIWYFALE